jgi:hypothetical protein
LVDQIPLGASPDLVAAARLDVTPLEQLPEDRQRYALFLAAAHRFETVTLRGSERLYIDSWGQKASSTDVRLYWDMWSAAPAGTKPAAGSGGDEAGYPRLELGPHARFHIQGPVDFWQRTYQAFPSAGGFEIPLLRTGDRELGPLFAVTFGSGLRLAFTEVVSASVRAEGIYTRFLDHLYVFDRWGIFTASTLEIDVE